MGGSVLIVDGDQGFTESAQSALEAQGVTVHVRDDASIDVIRKLRPTVIMVNVELPKGASTGFSICSRIRRDRELKGLPILLTSNEASVEALKRHAQSADRADDYARKPLSVQDLVARIGRLLQSAPVPEFEDKTPPPPPKNGSASLELGTDDLESDFDVEQRTESAVLRDTAAAPQPLPPPPSPPPEKPAPPSPPTSPPPPPLKAPPPLKREPVGATPSPQVAVDELWRPMRLEEALKTALDLPEPEKQGPSKATPEERLAYLRQLVKYYESRDKVFRDIWTNVQQQGQDLARKVVSLSLDANAKERKLGEAVAERDNTQRRLAATETEFKTFQDEITRIFRDKDSEEADARARMAQLTETNEKLARELKTAREQNRDDEHRLTIFQEEIGEVQGEKERAEAQVQALSTELGDLQALVEDLKARLEMTENVARERAEEIDKIREQLDSFAIQETQEKQRLAQDHSEQIFALETDYQTQIEHLVRERQEEVERLHAEHQEILAQENARHAELLEKLTATQESEVRAQEEASAQAEARAQALAEEAGQLQKEVKAQQEKLRAMETEHAAELGALRADIEALEATTRENDAKMVELESTLLTTTEERDDLARQIESTATDLVQARERIQTLEHQEEEQKQRIKQLEDDVDRAQNEAFERQQELERARKSQEKAAARLQNLETSLKIAEKAVSAAESRSRATDERTASLGRELESLAQEVQQTREALEKKEEELAHRDRELADAYAQISDINRRLEETAQSKDGELESARADAEALRVELDATHKVLSEHAVQEGASQARIEGLENELRSLRESERALSLDIASKDERIRRLDNEAAAMKRMTKVLKAALEALTRSRPSEEEAEIAREIRNYLGETGDLDKSALEVSEMAEAHAVVKPHPPPVTKPRRPAPGRPPLPPQKSAIAAHAPPPQQPPPPRTSEPFRALVSEMRAAEAESDEPLVDLEAANRAFDEAFAAEATTNDNPPVGRVSRSAAPPAPPVPPKKAAPARPSPPALPKRKKEDALEGLADLLSKNAGKPQRRSAAGQDEEEHDRVITEIIQLDEK